MENPFEIIEKRLSIIESLLFEIKHRAFPVEQKTVPVTLKSYDLTNGAEKLLSAKQAGEYLEISKGTVYNMVRSGKVPHHKRNGKLCFYRHDLDKYARKRKRKSV